MMRRTVPLLALVMIASVPDARAQDPNSWIGRKVVTKRKVLKVGGRDDVHRVFTVEQANGQGLRLVSGSVAGWVMPDQVVPFDRALDYFSRLTGTDQAAWAYGMRGLIWKDKGRYDIALGDYNESLRLDPDQAWVWISRGNVQDLGEEHDKALVDYNEAIRLDPKNALAFRSRGTAWLLKKDHGKAIADLDEAIRLDPKDAIAFNNRGNVQYLREDYDKALADYNEAIRLAPKHNSAYVSRGFLRYHKQDYAKAIADFDEAIRLDPRDAATYDTRAWLWATCPDGKHRDGKKAVESATRACELTEWKDAFVLNTLAAAHAEAGDFAKAVEWQEKSNKLYEVGEANKEGEDRLRLYKDRKPYRDEE